MATPECGTCGGGINTCDEEMECWCARATDGYGLTCDGDGVPSVKLAPGGNLVFDENRAIRDTCCDPDDPAQACRHTVDALGEFVVAGGMGGAGLLMPYGSPQAIDLIKATSTVDIIANRTFALVDGAATWGVYSPNTRLSYYTTNPTDAIPTGMTTGEWVSMWSDAGSDANATGRHADAPASATEVDGGWYGFYSRPFQLMTALAALERINGRKVTLMSVESPADDPDIYRNGVQAAIDAINTACVQNTAIIAVRAFALDHIATVVNAQIVAAVELTASDTTTPQQVTDAGATWVVLPWTVADARMVEFVSVGLNVLVSTNSRHHQTSRARELGTRGIIASDPLYAPGILGGQYLTYRRLTNSYVRRTTSVGHLTMATDAGSILNARGYTKSTESGLFVNVTDSRLKTAVLQGNLCPLETPEQYSLEWRCQVEVPDSTNLPAGSGPRMGPSFSMTRDVDAADDISPADREGYAAFIRCGDKETGVLVIGRYDAGANFTTLATSSTSRAVRENEWLTFRLDVTPTTITLTRTDGTAYSVTATDDTYRGPYFYWIPAKADTSGEFQGGLADMTVIPGATTVRLLAGSEAESLGTFGDEHDNAGTWGPLEYSEGPPPWWRRTEEDGTD